MAQTWRALTDEQREQQRAHQRELVIASIEQLRTSDGWQAYLRARARFPSYSWRNVLLILSQHPTAERVAGFRAWLELGYCVTKGSAGIRIWARCAPSPKRMRAWRDAGARPEDKPRATFKLVSVFAQDQVAELPPPATPAPLTVPIAEVCGDSHERLLGAVVSLAREIGYRVTIGDSGRAEGTCDRQTRQITIAERLAPNGRLAAGIHELAHALVGEDAAVPTLTYAQEELVVESIAWSCCQTVGLDTTANSIPYLTSWAQSASLEILEQTAALTGRLSDRIEAALGERRTTPSQNPPPPQRPQPRRKGVTMMMRYGLVASDAPAIAAYLPGNYRILGSVDGQTVIAGRDRAGWTLEGYVIPRLGSGLYFATEIDLSHPTLKQIPE